MADLKHVVVVGGGFAGIATSKALDKAGGVKVTLVDPTEVFVHKVSALRSSVDPAWADKCLVPRTNVLKREGNRIVQARVTSVAADGRSVALDSGETIHCDIIVCATGSVNASPGEPPSSATSQKQMLAAYKEFGAAVSASNDIVIVGGGIVGIEIAGEIKALYPKKNVTIVHSGKTFAHSQVTPKPAPAKFHTKVASQFDGLGIKYILEDRVQVPFEGAKYLSGNRQLETNSGKTISADLVVNCVGSKMVTDIYPSEWIGKNGLVQITPTLLVQGTSNVFAAGDIIDSTEAKLGYHAAHAQAPVVVKNVLALVRGQKPTRRHKPSPHVIMLTSIGPDKGVMATPAGTFGSFLAKRVKSRGLFLGDAYKMAGLPAPK